MPGSFAGRDMIISKGAGAGTPIAGFSAKTITINGTPIDSSTSADAGFQKFIAGKLTGRSIQFTGDGYEEDGILEAIAFNAAGTAQFLEDITITFSGGATLVCDWVMSGYTIGGPKDDGQTFSCTLTSNGEWAYTPAPAP